MASHNPEIDKTLDQLNKEVSSLSAESSTASADLSRLKDKDAASRIVPGESLSREESGRLRELQDELGDACRGIPSSMTDAKCRELTNLVKLRALSEFVPGEPLTSAESGLIASLPAKIASLNEERRKKERETERLKDLSTGSTYKMRDVTHETLSFSNVPLVTAHAGEELAIQVWENDVFESDLRGNGWVTLTRSVLDDGELRVRMGPHVDYVELRFRPALPQDE
ncbi:MAG: hypothetical protein F4Z28_12800 [Gammaproteobacteria bacterium]|nr:hypothetical protein [Gammaproteobacteria bacterium]